MRPHELTHSAYWRDLWVVPLLIFGIMCAALSSLVLVPVGVLLWTLAEYALHRWVFHGDTRFAASHADHHENPLDLVGAPPAVSVVFSALALITLALVGQAPALLMVGLLVGYFWYFLMHSALHHASPRPTHPLARALIRHARHHAGSRDQDFGITTPLWDWAFRTASTPRPPG